MRQRLESRLGAELDGVRIHTGTAAEESAADLGARAFTVGQHVHFAAGQYRPETSEGERLLAHELVHTVQQRDSGAASGASLPTSRSGDHAEVEARAIADQVGHGGPTATPRITPSAAQVSLAPDPAAVATLTADLQSTIDGAEWKKIRPRVYPKESAAGIQEAKERKAGKRADLTGLGKIKTLENFAAAIKNLQAHWPKTPDLRLKAIGKAIGDELVTVNVPRFRNVVSEPMEWKGYFTAGDWVFHLSEGLLNASTLGNDDAAELANTAMHEARHAEQQFLAARFAAGPPKNESAATIEATAGIHKDIAAQAVTKKFTAATDPRIAALGAAMYDAHVTHASQNQQISDDDYTREMAQKRAEARTALANLKASATDATFAEAKTKRDELKAAIAEVERRYTLYRNIPYEKDAHNVGDAAEQAFRGWPP